MASGSRIVFGAVFSIVFSSLGGCGVPRWLGVRPPASGAALVRFIAGDADLAPPREADLPAPERAGDLRDDPPFLAAVFLAAVFLAAVFFAPVPLLAEPL